MPYICLCSYSHHHNHFLLIVCEQIEASSEKCDVSVSPHLNKPVDDLLLYAGWIFNNSPKNVTIWLVDDLVVPAFKMELWQNKFLWMEFKRLWSLARQRDKAILAVLHHSNLALLCQTITCSTKESWFARSDVKMCELIFPLAIELR